MPRPRYKNFVDRIDIDALEDDLGFEVIQTHGDNDMGYCILPWGLHQHGDTTGKMGIHREKRIYNCWVCGGGSLLSLAMEVRGLDDDDAIDYLYQFAHGDKRDDQEFLDEFLDAFEDTEERIEVLPYFNKRVLKERFREGTNWFKEKGISEDAVDFLGLRFHSDLKKSAPKKGKFSDEDDYYGPAVIFPHFWQDRLVGWQHRWIDEDRPQWVGKFTNTPDFPKETTIYNYDDALHISENYQNGISVVVVESPKSVAYAIDKTKYPIMATFGSSVNPAQLRLLRRIQSGVILVPDNDGEGKAGSQWIHKITNYLDQYIPVFHCDPPPGPKGTDLANVEDVEEYLSHAYDACFADV